MIIRIAYIFLIVLIGCKGYVFQKQITNEIYLVAVDSREQMTLSYRLPEGTYIGIIGETIIWTGWEPRMNRIMVKQYLKAENKIRYFAIDLNKDYAFGYRSDGVVEFNERNFSKIILDSGKLRSSITELYSGE